MSSFIYPWAKSTLLTVFLWGGFSMKYEEYLMLMTSWWWSLYHLSSILYKILMNWLALGRWKTLSMLSSKKSKTTSLVMLFTTLSSGTKCQDEVMINSADCTIPGCDATFTNLERIRADLKVGLSIGLLQTLRNSPKSMCLRFVSLISAYSSCNQDFRFTP